MPLYARYFSDVGKFSKIFAVFCEEMNKIQSVFRFLEHGQSRKFSGRRLVVRRDVIEKDFFPLFDS